MGSKRKVSKQVVGAYPVEFRMKVVKLFLEEDYSVIMLSEEFGCSKSIINSWVRAYRKHGEQGLYSPSTCHKKASKPLNSNLKSQIIELKKADPQRGVRRISDIMRRFFLLPASPDTVRKTLHEAKLIDPPPKKRRKNIQKPRRFERATPNQMWQTDICTFRLAGKNAYLLGYIDDYSRYIVGMEIYRSQTATNLLEIYRGAVAEYGVPKEMLTDNGRQYTNWRGTTKFEKELKKDRVKHIKSSPHHPMTLGKIERFWKTILNEFLFRCQFDSFENARERLALWIKYYNYKRPHQGIGGLCPADRYFEVQNELKHTLENGVQENILELALRGKPQRPFYMVGRMGGQNVAIRAEKGKIKMHVDDPERIEGKELVYDLNMENSNGKESTDGNSAESDRATEGTEKDKVKTGYSCPGEVSGGFISVDGKPFSERNMPGIIGLACASNALAGDCDGSDIEISGPDSAQSQENGFEQTSGELINEPEGKSAAAGGYPSAAGGEPGQLKEEDVHGKVEESKDKGTEREKTRRNYFQGKKRRDERKHRGFRARRFS
jgi:transposase InsO family protein